METSFDDADQRVQRLLDEGDDLLDEGRPDQALSSFEAAWELLPEPRTDHPLTLHVLAAIGDARFFKADFTAGKQALMNAMKCSHWELIGNPFVRLRLGQCLFELGETRKAANWLAGAFLTEGVKLFAEDDPKYLEFMKSQLEPPPGGWPEGW